MKLVTFTAAILLALSIFPASAHHYRHRGHYVHPMVAGLGIGLAYMLRHQNDPPQNVGPRYAPVYETKAKAGELPNVLDIPPRGWPFRKATERHTERHYARRGGSRLASLDGSCRTAARMGGPCGCWAAEHFFGSPIRELWLAANWLKFPRTSPAPGTAAIWPNHHHVAPVVGVNGDGTVIVRDSWGTHPVRMAGLTFVSPHQ